MSDSRAFCPRCGDPVPERPEPGPGEARGTERLLCDSCYLAEFELIDAPESVRLDVCGTCGAVRVDEGEYRDVGERDYTDVAIEAVADRLGVHVDAEDVAWGVEAEQVDATTLRLHCEFEGVVRGRHLAESVTVPVSVLGTTCERCGRRAGDYYASVVQVRATGREPSAEETGRAEEIANDLVTARGEAGDRDAFVTEVTPRPEGLDLKLSTTALGKQVANKLIEEFGGDVSASETLVTEDEDGEGVYRVTYAVRLPRFRPGDVIDVDDEGPVLVRRARQTLAGVRVTTGEDYEAPREDVEERATLLGHRDDAEETTLVAIEDDHAVQVLDPETFESTTVARPSYLDPDAETVPVLKHREGLHVLPEP